MLTAARKTPKNVKNVVPVYPEPPAGTRRGGVWMGEVLLGTDGSVSHVWTIRDIKFTPPFPAFARALVDAVRQWKFEPVKINGTVVPACFTVTINVD